MRYRVILDLNDQLVATQVTGETYDRYNNHESTCVRAVDGCQFTPDEALHLVLALFEPFPEQLRAFP